MKNILLRFTNAFKVAWWAWKNPQTMAAHNFRMLSDLLALIFKVSVENKHYISHIAFIHPNEGEKQIVSIWAGAGVAADPVKRISELIEENAKLKSQLSRYIIEKEDTQCGK